MRHEPPRLTASVIGCLMRVERPALSVSVAVAMPLAVDFLPTTRNFVISMLTLSLPDFGGGVAADAAGTIASSASRQSSSVLRKVSLPGVRNARQIRHSPRILRRFQHP